jgi:glycosyltransferase involved in cell wall biosynthesis
MNRARRLAIVVSHPIQYYAPWFVYLHNHLGWTLRVFYLWDFGVTDQTDPRFGRTVKWDVDLLSGYEFEWIPNLAHHPGTESFWGLHNPSLTTRLEGWSPDAVMIFGYGWRTLTKLAFCWRGAPLILRGDTHLIGRIASTSIKASLRNGFLQLLFKNYRAFACVGQANRHFYGAHGVPPDHLHTVQHCIDNTRFNSVEKKEADDWRKTHGIEAKDFVFLFAGKFESKKRPDLLIRAFRETNEPSLKLVLIGDGELRATLTELADPDTRITLLPFHNQSQMPVVLHAADVLVLPSQGPGESWGLIVNESMAAGTPAIVSDHVGCAPDLVTDQQTGWVFPAGNQEALRDCMIRAYQKMKIDRETISRQVRKRIDQFGYPEATRSLATMLAILVPESPQSSL